MKQVQKTYRSRAQPISFSLPKSSWALSSVTHRYVSNIFLKTKQRISSNSAHSSSRLHITAPFIIPNSFNISCIFSKMSTFIRVSAFLDNHLSVGVNWLPFADTLIFTPSSLFSNNAFKYFISFASANVRQFIDHFSFFFRLSPFLIPQCALITTRTLSPLLMRPVAVTLFCLLTCK